MGNLILSLSFAIPLLLASIAGVYALLDASTAPKHKRTARLFQGCCAWYFVILYALAWASTATNFKYDDTLLYVIRSGLATRFGIVLIWIWIIIDIRQSRTNNAARAD